MRHTAFMEVAVTGIKKNSLYEPNNTLEADSSEMQVFFEDMAQTYEELDLAEVRSFKLDNFTQQYNEFKERMLVI